MRKSRRVSFALLLLGCFCAGGIGGALVRRIPGEPSATDSRRAPQERSQKAFTKSDGAAFSRHFQKGVEYLSEGRYSNALEELSRAAELNPTDPRPHHGLGKVYNELILKDRAEQAFRKAIDVDPEYLPSKKSLAKILHDLGRYEEALALLREMEKRTPDDPFVWAELAINWLALGNVAEAIRLLEKYNAVEGEQSWGYMQLGRAYAKAGQHQRGEAALRRAIAIDRSFALAYYWLGQLLVEMGRKEESEKPLSTYRKLRQLQNQEHQLRMALLRDAESVPALVHLARIRTMLGKPQEALTLLERARRLAPEDAKLAEIYAKVREAVEAQRRAAESQNPAVRRQQ